MVIIINSYVIMLLLCAVVFGSYMYLHVKVIIILSLFFCFKISLYVAVILRYIMVIINNNYVIMLLLCAVVIGSHMHLHVR